MFLCSKNIAISFHHTNINELHIAITQMSEAFRVEHLEVDGVWESPGGVIPRS